MKNKIEISNPEKIIFPKDKITKGNVVEYYAKIAPRILPHLKNRLLTLQRFPNGIDKEGFYQKNKSEYFPDWIKTHKDNGTEYVICNDKETLIYLANQAVIDLHTWTSTTENIDKPNKMILDLDPPKENNIGFSIIYKTAIAIKKILEEIGLAPFLMTTGSRSVHIVVPIKSEGDFDYVRDFARKIADLVASLNPDKLTTDISLEKRKGKLFIDPFRNSRAQTAICPYSLRSRVGAPVAAPLDWKELNENFDPKKYALKNVMKRKNDPWKDYFRKSYSLKEAEKKLDELIS